MQLNQLLKKASTGFEPAIPILRSFKSVHNQHQNYNKTNNTAANDSLVGYCSHDSFMFQVQI